MNILVTAIGSFSADCVIKTLRKNGHFVAGCDIYPPEWHAASRECNIVCQAPLATNEKEYIAFLLDICKRHGIQRLFPLTDLEIDVLNKRRNAFNGMGGVNTLLCIPSEECLSIARNKYKTFCLFKDDGTVNVPNSVLSSELTEAFPLPAVAKPISGRSSEGLLVVRERQELERLKAASNYIVQELLEGNVFTVDYVRNASASCDFAVPREELLRTKNGAGTVVRITPDEALIAATSYIGRKLGINGCVNMEYIRHGDAYYLIDINPRFSAGVAFTSFVGYDMVSAHLNCFLEGGAMPAPIEYGERLLCKRYIEEALL